MEYFVIGDEDTVLGFSIAGTQGIAASNADEAKTAFSKALADPHNGIIIITEPVADLIRSTVDQYLFKSAFPLVVEIPGPDGKSERNLRELAQKAIGISV